MARSDPWQSAAAALAALGIAASLLPQNALADELIPGTAGCAIASNPSTTTVSCLRVGLDKNGRLPSCRTNENCVSTSSVKVPSKFVAPWNYAPRTTDAAVAFSQLVNELRGMDGAALTEVDTAGLYLRAEFPSTVPPNSVDVVEFVLRPDENLALFRSATRDSVFVYPLQQPLSDRGGNARRLEDVRTRLGWASLRYTGDGSE